MAYSIDFRRKVLAIKDRDGLSFEETALRFGVGKSSVSRWAKRLEPCLTMNKPATKITAERLVSDVEQPISMSVRSGLDAVSAAYVKR